MPFYKVDYINNTIEFKGAENISITDLSKAI